MYATTTAEFEEYATNILESEVAENYKKRFSSFLDIKHEWGICFRQNIMTRGHNTNNYSEATMRIMKDIILQRTKAFNAVALVDYCSTVWEQYSKNRLLNFANGRKDNSFYKLNLLETRTKNFNPNLIKKIDGGDVFIVPSLSDTNLSYEVNCHFGCCTCMYGSQGAFCKHQYLVNKHFKKTFPSAPPTSASEKYELAKLALGDAIGHDLSFYTGFKLSDQSNSDLALSLDKNENASDIYSIQRGVEYSNPEEEEEIQENLLLLTDNLSTVVNLLPKTKLTNKYLKYLNIQLGKITNSQQALDNLMQVSAVFRKKKGRIIKVQPTAIARRRKGVSRGSKRINSGRPALVENKKNKRKHNLSGNINKNKANAILH